MDSDTFEGPRWRRRGRARRGPEAENGMRLLAIVVGALLAGGPPAAGEDGKASAKAKRPVWKATGQLEQSVLKEASGVVESRRHPGVFWAHGDSGNDPKIVACDGTGRVLAEVMIAQAPNTDWEDICADDAGNLYLGDIGNNKGMFPARYIYRIVEPDPLNPPAGPVEVTARWRFKYPDDRRFNCESMFWHAGSLYVLARGGESVLYRLEQQQGGEMTLSPVALPRVFDATGADVSADGSRLLVCSPMSLRVFPLTGDDRLVDAAKRKRVFYPPPKNGAIEGCCFSGSDVVLMDESGALYRVTGEQIERQVRFVRP